MRIGIDSRFITTRPRRGIGNYSLNLVLRLIDLYPTDEFYLYISDPDTENILPIRENVRVCKIGPSFYPLWEQFSLPVAVSRDGIDILHCLGNTAPIFLPKNVKLILSLMDVMFLQDGDLIPRPTSGYQQLGRYYRALISPLAAKKSLAVITISEFSRVDILHSIPSLSPEKVFVTHLSCDPIFMAARDKLDANCLLSLVNKPFILSLGAKDPRKNTLQLVRAFLAILDQAHGEFGYKLVISGYSDWQQSEAYKLVERRGAEEMIIFLPFIGIDELAALYSIAELFIYPSLYEGFGIPIIEAFSAGCPVIASNCTSIPEIGGDAVIYVNPLDESEIAKSIQSTLSDIDLRNELKEKGLKRASNFSWENTAKETYRIYSQISRDITQ